MVRIRSVWLCFREISRHLWEAREMLVEQALGVHGASESDGQAVKDAVRALQESQKALELEIVALDLLLEEMGANVDWCVLCFLVLMVLVVRVRP